MWDIPAQFVLGEKVRGTELQLTGRRQTSVRTENIPAGTETVAATPEEVLT